MKRIPISIGVVLVAAVVVGQTPYLLGTHFGGLMLRDPGAGCVPFGTDGGVNVPMSLACPTDAGQVLASTSGGGLAFGAVSGFAGPTGGTGVPGATGPTGATGPVGGFTRTCNLNGTNPSCSISAFLFPNGCSLPVGGYCLQNGPVPSTIGPVNCSNYDGFGEAVVCNATGTTGGSIPVCVICLQ